MTLNLNLQRGLVGHWTMDDADISGGTLYDRSAVDAPDATINDGITTGNTGSPIGQHTESDGSSYIGTRYYIDSTISGGLSFATWVKDLGNVNGRYFSTDISDYFGAWNSNTTGDIALRMTSSDNNTYSITIQINVDEWHHVAMVWDHTVPEARYYLDGNLYTSETVSSAGIGTGAVGRYLILHDGSESSNYNTGQGAGGDNGLSDFRLYHRPLSDSEINALYQMREGRYAYL